MDEEPREHVVFPLSLCLVFARCICISCTLQTSGHFYFLPASSIFSLSYVVSHCVLPCPLLICLKGRAETNAQYLRLAAVAALFLYSIWLRLQFSHPLFCKLSCYQKRWTLASCFIINVTMGRLNLPWERIREMS